MRRNTHPNRILVWLGFFLPALWRRCRLRIRRCIHGEWHQTQGRVYLSLVTLSRHSMQ